MAIVQLGAIAADIRGSVSGNTWSRNLGGAYVRKRIVPVNPDTSRQIAARARLATVANAWSNELTPAQRTAWDVYSEGTVWTNRLGLTITITGLAAFVRTNALYLIGYSTLKAAAPTLTGHGSATQATFAAYHDTDILSLNNPTLGWDKDLDDDLLFVFAGIPLTLGSARIPNRFRWASMLVGNQSAPQTFPYAIASPWPIEEDQRITIRMVHVDPDGRVSFATHASVDSSPST